MNRSQYPKESLRKKLIVAGVPDSQHTLESLASMISKDLNLRPYEDMSADEVAEVLLYLIATGGMSLPVTADKALLDMPWGSHVCQFYKSKEDLLQILVPFFKEGLEKNEACLWVVADLTVEEARNALTTVVPDLQNRLTTGQMEIRHYTDFHARPDGTLKPTDKLLDLWGEKTATVIDQGFAGIRASGSTSWISDRESMSQFMEYETKFHCAIQNSRILAVCTYPVRSGTLQEARELINNHGRFFVKRGQWMHDLRNAKDVEKLEAIVASLARL